MDDTFDGSFPMEDVENSGSQLVEQAMQSDPADYEPGTTDNSGQSTDSSGDITAAPSSGTRSAPRTQQSAPAPQQQSAPAPQQQSAPQTQQAAPAPQQQSAPAPQSASGPSRTVHSTAYCLTGTMASGKRVYEGAAAMNGVPLGSRYRVLSGPAAGRSFTIEDRIGSGSQFDIAYPGNCGAARQYGRRTISVERM
ncbi:MAG: hypothetical protein KY393_07025 [Actinobacteria bacterium]|nr:hypothetical protein [Actinomycetota bacterium]